MDTKGQAILAILKEKEAYLKKRFGVKALGVFGSFAHGQQTPASDVDILADFYRTPSLFDIIRLEKYLSRILKRKVEVIRKPALRKEIKRRVLNEVVYP